jgi:tetratricopeptide (TPR) repeat protein
MRHAALLILGFGVGACGAPEDKITSTADAEAPRLAEAGVPASLPRAPGTFAPSLVGISGDEKIDGVELADVETCATCHPDAWAQWQDSAHSFASFGNPIYRFNVEIARDMLSKEASQHCGGCHDMPLVVDGTMLTSIPHDDIRAHNGVTCRLCHGIESVTVDGNGSYVLKAEPLLTPIEDDLASIEAHKKSVSVKPLGTELCMSCHRGFLSPDIPIPVHMAGIDEPTAWRSSAWSGNGAGRIDKVEPKTCIDCHMARETASDKEVAAKNGTIASHRFAGGHTWMAAMRKDADQLAYLQDNMLRGVASIDISGARIVTTGGATWHLPADGAPVVAGGRIDLDVVMRNQKVGHRFPGGVNDMQDTWIEIVVTDATGARIAVSGVAHERDAKDEEAHVLRSLPVDEHGTILEEHELPLFRGLVANHTLAARETQSVRYVLEVPKKLKPSQLPLTVSARMRHRSRSLLVQNATCRVAKTPAGKQFLHGVADTRDVMLDPCAAMPITEIAQTSIQIGSGAAAPTSARPKWERLYEHGMALVAVVTERLDEARQVLDAALAAVPAGEAKPRAMILVQLASVAGKQGRTDDAMKLLDEVEKLLPAPHPAAVHLIRADALARVWRWDEAVAPARAAAERAPGNTFVWVMLARVLASSGDDRGALDAARKGLALQPREPDLLRSQAVALRALGSPLADQALAAFDRFRQPDANAELRIACARKSERCAREREMGHSHPLTPVR